MRHLTALGCSLIVAVGIVVGLDRAVDRFGRLYLGNPRIP